MTLKPLRPCRHPGCPALTRDGYCPKHKPAKTERRVSAQWHGWYSLPIWTDDLHRAHRVAGRLNAGTVSVNTVDALDVTVPFGGNKQSGFGRDLSLHAFDKFTTLKTTWFQFR